MKRNEYVDYLLELMASFGASAGGVTARAMFGGFGVFKAGRMFGLIVDDVLYLKTDDLNRAQFEAQSLAPFSYAAKDKVMTMAYHRAPAEALENAAVMHEWATESFAAALRTGVKKKPNPKRKKVRANPAIAREPGVVVGGAALATKPLKRPKRPKRVKPVVASS